MLMELAHRLAVSEAPWIREIRDRLIVLINPVAEPDGRDRMVDWFYRHLKGKTDWENLPPLSPPYWGKYVRHDNNRDGIQRKLALTRATQDAYLKWLPIVMHDLHESVPLLSIWTGTGPYNTNIDPSVFSEWHTIAFQEVATLTAMGLPGVWTYGFGEGFAQVYQDSPAINHNGLSRGYETFGNATAETVERVHRRRAQPLHRPRRDRARLVPDGAAAEEAQVVAAQQHQLHADRCAGGAAVHGPQQVRDAAQLLAPRRDRGPQGHEREAVRDRDPGEAGGPQAARAPRQPAARPRHRGLARAGRLQGQGGRVSSRHVRGAARPALPRLRARPAHAPEVPGGQGALGGL